MRQIGNSLPHFGCARTGLARSISAIGSLAQNPGRKFGYFAYCILSQNGLY